jgi:hypothetical protein
MTADKFSQSGTASDASLAGELARINAETARIAWRDLQRFFAQGHAIYVAPELDLVDVALQMQRDNRSVIEIWLSSAHLAPVSDAQALDWFENDATHWCVVVRPWVLVQPDSRPAHGSIK